MKRYKKKSNNNNILFWIAGIIAALFVAVKTGLLNFSLTFIKTNSDPKTPAPNEQIKDPKTVRQIELTQTYQTQQTQTPCNCT